MVNSNQGDILNRIIKNDHLAISRAITLVESGDDINDKLFSGIYPHTHNTIKLGITGPPGAGKSTLTDQLIRLYLNQNKSVGVIAVDPSSPFSGGALLGDRVRMNNYLWNDNVFIRSMGSKGNLGGLNKKAQEAGDILAASGKDIVIYETVGVGQGEHDIAKAADLTIVLLVPESGDDIQLMKAGLIEIADLFVVNKSDRNGSEKLVQSIYSVLHIFKNKDNFEPPVFKVSADRGDGVEDLFNGIGNFLNNKDHELYLENKKISRYKDRVFNIIQNRLIDSFWTNSNIEKLELTINDLKISESSPYQIAEKLLNTK
ncbi:MAG: hypothetical protein CBE10_00600 [bacterium TMED250]|nr:MAG: hypothetical protein CBE10_00600 [bacterium TMED250]|tara:strand:+ start:1548 stop:2495 length:948 start_codon:yes stop_codon:yes gene_type:complete